MPKRKFKIHDPFFDISNILEIIGALYLFFYFAQIIRGSPLVLGIIFIIVGFVIKELELYFRRI